MPFLATTLAATAGRAEHLNFAQTCMKNIMPMTRELAHTRSDRPMRKVPEAWKNQFRLAFTAHRASPSLSRAACGGGIARTL